METKMDSTKLENLITENMKSIFGFALTRTGNVKEAECLASDILYEIIKSSASLREEERFYGFMWKIAENTYMQYLRNKSKASIISELDESIADKSNSAEKTIIQGEDLNLLRRELSLLSKQYRDTTVLYYIENLRCSEIADKLQISTEMVKYYLFRARKIIREGMNMERLYGEKSYRPSTFEIDYWGSTKYNPNEHSDFAKRKIKGNILLSAYYSPVTIQEISIELGVALPYLEDEIKLLLDSEYLLCNNGKYLTNIPIFTSDCTAAIEEKLKELIKQTAENFIAVEDKFTASFGNRFSSESLARWQKMLLCVHYSLMENEKEIKSSYNKQGAIWGRCFENEVRDNTPKGIQGFYNGCLSTDTRGSVIAINFEQTLNAQHFEFGMTDPLVATAVGCFEQVPKEWKEQLDKEGYTQNGKPSFSVWTKKEYHELRKMLSNSISILSELNRKTSELAASITSDLAPAHIRETARYVGAVVYRFNAIDNLVKTLFDMNWLKATDDKDKPAICVVKN